MPGALTFGRALLLWLVAVKVGGRVDSNLRLHVVAPVYREYAAAGALIHAMLAQSDPRW